jgi:hypothetical protein
MSGMTSSGLKTSVSAAAAVTLTALIAWSFDAYTGHLQQRANDSVTTAQADFGTTASARDTSSG